MRTRIAAALLPVLVFGGVVSCAEGEIVRSAGAPALTATDGLSVKIKVTEFGFDPPEVEVVSGASVRFIVRNVGLLPHDVALDRMPSGDEPPRPTFGSMALGPMATATFDVVFEDPGEYVLGCTEPGHWASGMRARVQVD